MIKSTIFIYKKSNLLNSSGGVEKMLSWFANAFSKDYKVYLATRDKKKGTLFYPLSDEVIFKHFTINFSRFRRIIGRLTYNVIPYFNRELFIANKIRQYCDKIKPDVIITTGIQDLSDIVYHNPYPCKKIVQLHSEPSLLFTKKKRKLFEKNFKTSRYCAGITPLI